MAAKSKPDILTVAVTLDGVFGFIGKDVSVDDGELRLQDALSIGYNTDGTPRLGLNQIPLGMVDPRYSTITAIPRTNISYVVTFKRGDGHEMSKLYDDFFTNLLDAG